MQCIVVKSDEFENSSPLIYFLLILIMLLLTPFGHSAAIKAEVNADHCFAFGRNTTLAFSSVCYNLKWTEKIANILGHLQWLSCEMKSEKWALKFHTDDNVTTQIRVVLLIGWSKFPTNQKLFPDLGGDESSVWNFCAHFSGIIL